MKKTPVKGTNDYLPKETALRNYLQRTILDVYVANGFEHIITPAIEDAENLSKSEGGDNLNLIFNILKRGEKLEKLIEDGITADNQNELYDLGLRYDLTLPLSRYFANNQNELLLPMKCIQIDRVYRAEKPQKGRLREFTQCDIDILGDESGNAEAELILTTAKALFAIGLKNFTVRINDRRLLHAVLSFVGFASEDMDSVCISFDKMDKIGMDGVCEELAGKGYDAGVIAGFKEFMSQEDLTLEKLAEKLTDKEPANSLLKIMDNVSKISDGEIPLKFDISLVRGQGYYTGTVFEIVSEDFGSSVAGGGRYDRLIGKFLGKDVPAVGFSIGFERIFSILSEKGAGVPDSKKQIAVLYNEDELVEAARLADKLREDGYAASLYVRPKKTGKFIDRLQEYGFAGFVIMDEKQEVSFF